MTNISNEFLSSFSSTACRSPFSSGSLKCLKNKNKTTFICPHIPGEAQHREIILHPPTKIILLYVYEFCLHVHMCVTYIPDAHKQETALVSLELELRKVVSHFVNAGNPRWFPLARAASTLKCLSRSTTFLLWESVLLSSHESYGLNSGCQAQQQVPLLTEPFHFTDLSPDF